MFDWLTDTVEEVVDAVDETFDTSLGVLDNLMDGELPSRQQLTTLVESGLSIYAIADITDTSVDALQKILEE